MPWQKRYCAVMQFLLNRCLPGGLQLFAVPTPRSVTAAVMLLLLLLLRQACHLGRRCQLMTTMAKGYVPHFIAVLL